MICCSNCFKDEGLKLKAFMLGEESTDNCPNCESHSGAKLDKEILIRLAHSFFVWGSLYRCDYGFSPVIEFNESQKTDIDATPTLKKDMELFERALGIGFFYYEPRLWMVGENEPLKDLCDTEKRFQIIEKILSLYPTKTLTQDEVFYRLRINPNEPDNHSQYDSPPSQFLGTGRLDDVAHPILYGSQDIEVCLHECRVTALDDIFLATIRPNLNLKLLDLSRIIDEASTEFESVDLAVYMLFLATDHSYETIREISKKVQQAGFDGIIYPSYFSLLRTGSMLFDTTYGMSNRKIPEYKAFEQSKIVENIALFGYPIKDGKVEIKCINKIILTNVKYNIQFGPVISPYA